MGGAAYLEKYGEISFLLIAAGGANSQWTRLAGKYQAFYFTGVQARIKEKEPRAVFVHCTAHRLNLVVKDSLDGIPELRDAIHEAASLISFYRDSPKRLVNLSDMGASTALRPLCPTRWTCSEGALQSIMDNYMPLRESLLQLASDRTTRPEIQSKANGFARRMEEFTFFYGVSLALHLLRMTTPVMRAVQGEKQTVSANLSLLAGLSEALTGQRGRHDTFWARTVSQAAKLEVDEPRLKRQMRPPRRLDSGGEPAHPKTPEEAFKRLFIEAIDHLQRSITCRCQEADKSDDRVLAAGEKALLTGEDEAVSTTARFYGLNEPRLHLHTSMLQDLCEARGRRLSSLQDVVDVLNEGEGEKRVLLEECTALVKLLLTAPATSCTAERSFSMLRRLKSYLRTTITQERLNHTAVLATHANETMALDRDALIQDFITECSSRRHVFGSW